MALIEVEDAQAWLETTKLTLSALDERLEGQIATEVLARLGEAYETTGWTTPATTPKLVKKIISMKYAAAIYQRTYSEDPGVNDYALLLDASAEQLIAGILAGALTIAEEEPLTGNLGSPAFYPNDNSSALQPTYDDPSLGPSKFTMGVIW